jgi:hypothetical protein
LTKLGELWLPDDSGFKFVYNNKFLIQLEMFALFFINRHIILASEELFVSMTKAACLGNQLGGFPKLVLSNSHNNWEPRQQLDFVAESS